MRIIVRVKVVEQRCWCPGAFRATVVGDVTDFKALTTLLLILLQALANACMDAEPGRRPTFAELEPMLTALRKEYR